jgi:hypothetical protein
LLLRIGQLSELLMQLAQAGGRLEELRLINLRMLPMHGSIADAVAKQPCDALGCELVLAAPALAHLRELDIFISAISLDFVPCLPSLSVLDLGLRALPPVTKLELLLSRQPELHCGIELLSGPVRPEWRQQNQTVLPQLKQLAQQCTRLSVKETW